MVDPHEIHIPIDIICYPDQPIILMPPDAFGDREKLTVQQAQQRLLDILEHTSVCSVDRCLACELYETLEGIR